MKITNVKLLFLLFVISSCNKWRNEDPIVASSTQTTTLSECSVNSITTSAECVARSGKYIYDAQFGGRGLVQTDQTGSDGQLSLILPDGWYSGRTASIFDSDLQGSNIQTSFNFFGIAGSLSALSYPACTIDTNIANPAACTLTSGNYAYTQSYGGRSSVCSTAILPSSVGSACWLSGAGWYLNGSSTSNCSIEGLQSSQCRVQDTKYWYTTAYGGRSANCTIPGVNGAACWTNATGIYVLDSSCVDGYNGGACVTAPSKYVYTSEYGGRNVDCTNNSAGSCYFTAAKNVIESNLTAINIKTGYTIFGIGGSYGGVNTDWGSAMNRDSATTKLTLADETTTYAGINSTLPAGYRAVASIDLDTDGGILNGSPQVTVVDRTGWNATTCGTSGNISARISNCVTTFAANATWNGNVNGNSGQGIWQLVSRSGNLAAGLGEEIWKDATTGLMWSSLVSSNLNWCKAIGHSNSANTNIVAQALNEDDPNDICDQIFYQNQLVGVDVVSACTEYVGLTTTDTDINNLGKSNLNKASTPSVVWRAPTMYDYMIANQNGLRFVMPDMQSASQGDEWTSTIYSADRAQAWTFNGSTGQRKIQNRSFTNSMRCIGR